MTALNKLVRSSDKLSHQACMSHVHANTAVCNQTAYQSGNKRALCHGKLLPSVTSGIEVEVSGALSADRHTHN